MRFLFAVVFILVNFSANAVLKTRSVMGDGNNTKIAVATKNILVSDDCAQPYNACMDAFCMDDNLSGGRCVCSADIKKYDEILAQIDDKNKQTYKLATVAVKAIENDIPIRAATQKQKSKSRIDLSLWDAPVDDFDPDSIANARGEQLFALAHEQCVEQLPECASDMDMLKLLYNQQIKSDCIAYDNSIKQQQQDSAQKLFAAQTAVRDAAMEQFESKNKYNLGQCTIEFRKCMQKTAGCGDDFTGCTTVVAIGNTNARDMFGNVSDKYQIRGSQTSIEISAATYEQLESKKIICEHVTEQCQAVADQVWDSFLRDVGPQIKMAEMIAEDEIRQDCIGNITSCFHKACKDNIDPRDADGSYDMCLTRPESMLTFCAPQLNACGVDTSTTESATASGIWGYVAARLAAMRVDSCTNAVRECLQEDARCGKNYTQCIGLDTDTIMRMCQHDKLVACQQKYGDDEIRGERIYDELANMVTGIMLNIDNELYDECQRALDESMIRICGSTTECNRWAASENYIGARSLEYKICEYSVNGEELDINFDKCRTDISQITDAELGRTYNAGDKLGPVTPLVGAMDGMIFWGSIEVEDDGSITSVEQYLKKAGLDSQISSAQMTKVSDELSILNRNIDATIQLIEQDPRVQYCMTGRDMGQITGFEEFDQVPRFPNLTQSARRMISNSALTVAKSNYYELYDELNARMLKDYAEIYRRQADIRKENARDVYREAGRQACLGLAEMSTLPKSPNPPTGWGTWFLLGATIGASILAFGAAGVIVGAMVAMEVAVEEFIVLAVVLTTAGTGFAKLATSLTGVDDANRALNDVYMNMDLSSTYTMNQWNYQETVTTQYIPETMVCQKCTTIKDCLDPRRPWVGGPHCKKWAEPKQECTEIQF